MQQSGCEEIRLLISRFVDDEVTQAERARVEAHVSVCDECAYKMVELMEMALLFAETPLRRPDPDLRSEVFGEIARRKERSRRVEDLPAPRRGQRPWYLPTPPPAAPPPPFHVRLMRAASPFAMAAVALFFFLGALALGNWPGTNIQGAKRTVEVPLPPYLPTREMPLVGAVGPNGGVPGPVGTMAVTAQGTVGGPAGATPTLGRPDLLALAEPTPVYEEEGASSKSGWHVVRDGAHGYTVHYPPNWWTRTIGTTRYFYPWSEGGTRRAPYWIELLVTPNSLGLTAATGNEAECGGKCEIVEAEGSALSWLRRDYNDDDTYNDVGYLFDSNYVYRLKLSVPNQTLPGLGGFQERVAKSQTVFGLMSGRLVPRNNAEDDPAYGGVLFLNGTDLWLTNAVRGSALRVTIGAGVRRFAQSPDLANVAYTSSDNEGEVWGTSLYVTRIVPGGPEAPTLLARNMDFQDVAWYGDRALLVLARDSGGQLGLLRFSVPDPRYSQDAPFDARPVLLTALDDRFSGARALSVSPDRQLVTFLAPVGPNEGTDLYAVRPDGSGLTIMVGHDEPLAPVVGSQRALAPDSQALKSYVWADGRLEQGGYAATILFTSGNSESPSWDLGGYFYSTARSTRDPALDPAVLSKQEAEGLQVIHIAYSSTGKVALTGYVNDRNGRADQLVGLWTADVVRGAILNPRPMPVPDSPNGITDLQWTPDGTALVYRETIPYRPDIRSARYDGVSNFRIVRLDVGTGETTVLFQPQGR
jgi:hypothetical protein